MHRRLVELLCALAFITLGLFVVNDNLKTELIGMGIGASVALIIDLSFFLYSERKFLRLNWDCFKPWGNKEIRLSIGYLYKIECNGKYLLVKNERFNRVAYQPVGGVYKSFHPEVKTQFDNLGLIPCTAIENDEKSEFDLRLKMLNRKNLRKFIRWFSTNKQREIDPWREFYEELVTTGILSKEQFGFIYYELIGQNFEPIHYDKFFNIDTFKYVDVYSPRFATREQVDAVKELMQHTSDKHIWVSEEEIKKGVSDDGKSITDHTYKIFENKKL
jgi:hypothetical protein